MVNVNMKLEMDSCLEDIFSYELEQLVDKYKNVNIEDKQSLEKLYSLIHKSNLPSYDMALSDAIKLSKEDTKLIKLYLWIRKNIQIDSIEDAKDILDKLEHDNYCILQEEHLIAYKDKDIDSAYREIFNELIDDVDYVAEFFTKSKLAELWIEDISIKDAIDEIISIEDPLEEYLSLEFDDVLELGNNTMRYLKIEY